MIKLNPEEMKQEFVDEVSKSQYFFASIVITNGQIKRIVVLKSENQPVLAVHCMPIIEQKPGASVMTPEYMELGERISLSAEEATDFSHLLLGAAALICKLRIYRKDDEDD